MNSRALRTSDILKNLTGIIYHAPGRIFGFDPDQNERFFDSFLRTIPPFFPADDPDCFPEIIYLEIRKHFLTFLEETFPEFFTHSGKNHKANSVLSLNKINPAAQGNPLSLPGLKTVKELFTIYQKMSRQDKLRFKLPYLIFADLTAEELQHLRKTTSLKTCEILPHLRIIRETFYQQSRRTINTEWNETGRIIQFLYREHRLNHLQNRFRESEENHNFDLETVDKMEDLKTSMKPNRSRLKKEKHLRCMPFVDDETVRKLLGETKAVYEKAKSKQQKIVCSRMFPNLETEEALLNLAITSRVFLLAEHLSLYAISPRSGCPDTRTLIRYSKSSLKKNIPPTTAAHISKCKSCSATLQYLSRCRMEHDLKISLPSSMRRTSRRLLKKLNRIHFYTWIQYQNNGIVSIENNLSGSFQQREYKRAVTGVKIPLHGALQDSSLEYRYKNGIHAALNREQPNISVEICLLQETSGRQLPELKKKLPIAPGVYRLSILKNGHLKYEMLLKISCS